MPLLSNYTPIMLNNLNHDEFLLHSPIKFTPHGINNFLSITYNHPKYASEILPHNTGHFMQLLEHGSFTHQDSDYIQAVLHLFRQKISSIEYLSANELERITSLVPTILANYLDPKNPNYSKKNSRKLKNLFVHIIENCLNKTLWDCQNGDLMTTQLLNIGNNLENITRAGIIEDQDDLNDLIHILVDRFIYVLGIGGAELPISFYNDLKNKLYQACWMQIPEVETLIQTKLNKIDKAFLTSKIKSQASETFGIL